MLTIVALVVALVLSVTVLTMLALLLRRRPEHLVEILRPQLSGPLGEQLLRTERSVREEVSTSGRGVRDEVGQQIGRVQEQLIQATGRLFEMQSADARRVQDTVVSQLCVYSEQLQALAASGAHQTDALRSAVQEGLRTIQESNEVKLEQMRVVVDEKLQGSLDARIGASFKQVSDRLELVSRGLSDMQQLAVGVGDLRKVLSNVKVRGIWGELQLETLLSQMLTAEQYEKNVAITPGSNERVEFAIRMPGAVHEGQPVLLPVDCKFPIAAWQRLVDASERSDAPAVADAEKELDAELRRCAASIAGKYILPPRTTDIGILYLPVEALYADVARRTALQEEILQKYRVFVAGPTTLGALLTSLQMGYRTVAIQERSEDIMKILGGVKTDFAKFGVSIEKLQKQLMQASNTVADLDKRRNLIGKKLRHVETGAHHQLADSAEDGLDQEALDLACPAESDAA